MFVVNVAALKELPKICETVAKMLQQLWSCSVAMISQIMCCCKMAIWTGT